MSDFTGYGIFSPRKHEIAFIVKKKHYGCKDQWLPLQPMGGNFMKENIIAFL